ncbi:hypothetical protein GV794_27805 [Nocardia cyriacigeorgica]|uniref:Serine/threonine protein kinase n=1 Tax=Nocardia cyriacigeorgica TaxID=135487 RepID=A0A6P1DBD1_9NOCA|nr:hypothetical protein [Nocardia cyriacigeorgica]NEW42540.1 hypothetical protein [Nocardia cyriacigeorgica]NEW46881.1 hypothetical protein [Nocardia cyriacigeorgica]NEW53645.1 hypothetical protein [Nocardia cyriacigeorgica]NEW59408.1 hypothetical protein [Nocardia cyriacigeorgica]
MRVFKHGARLGLAVAAILAGSLTMAAPANAATPASVCGSGFRVIDTHGLGNLATIYLLYNGRTNCVVTWKTAYIGTKTVTKAEVAIWDQANSLRMDMNMYAYYAGPVKVDAPGKCIMWGGSASPTDISKGYNWNSGRSHCG